MPALFVPLDPDQPLGAEGLGPLHQLIDLIARKRASTAQSEPADLTPAAIVSEKTRKPVSFNTSRRPAFRHSSADPACRFRTFDRPRKTEPRKWSGELLSQDGPEDFGKEPLHEREELFLCRKRHLEIELRKFRLPVCAEIFITEAADDLVVAIQATIIKSCLNNWGD